MGPLGAQEIICIFVLALLLFGPKKLPELGRMLGKAVSEFRRAKSELKATFETHLNELDRETRTSLDTANTSYSSPQYPYPYDDYGRYDSDYGSTSTPDESTPVSSSTGDSGAEPHHEYAEAESHAVEGTVPRSNGTRPVEPVSASTEEEHHG